ncbi:MAG: caspase family protein [Candidatus Eremiobacteraeota bacterium]|nr:caspase family protein [Candidatus Eremiobacteraeota bacterium]
MRMSKWLFLFILIFAALFSPRAAEAGTRKALLIGVNEYTAVRNCNLLGCENDTDLMSHLLTMKYGFKKNDIKVLRSREATLNGIRRALEEFLTSIAPDDTVVFFFSGHGTRTNDLNGDEPDGYDEALCPRDAVASLTAPRNLLLDDELGSFLGRIPARNLTVILDCCFSGTATRALSDTGTKGLQGGFLTEAVKKKIKFMNPGDFNEAVPASGKRFFDTRAKSGSKEAGTSIILPWVVISGCASYEKSQESSIEVKNRTFPCGLLTKHLFSYLSNNPKDTYEDSLREIKRAVVAENPLQTPQLEGNYLFRGFFKEGFPQAASSEPRARPPVQSPPVQSPPVQSDPVNSVTAVNGATATISTGAGTGITSGSLLAAYPPASTGVEKSSSIGLLRVKTLDAVSCTADIIEGLGRVVPGCPVREKTRVYANAPVTVAIEDFTGADGIAAKLGALPYVKVERGNSDADRLILPSLNGGGYGLYAPDFTLLQDFRRESPGAIAAAAAPSLKSAYYIKCLGNLRNPLEPFSVKLDLDEDKPVYKVGDQLGVTFRTDEDCHLILLHVSSDGLISVIFPNRYDSESFVKKGRKYTIPPFRDGKFLFTYRIAGPSGQEMIKAIATREYIDPWGIDPKSLRSAFREIEGDPVALMKKLLETLRQKLEGTGQGPGGGVSLPVGAGDRASWATDGVTYVIEE